MEVALVVEAMAGRDACRLAVVIAAEFRKHLPSGLPMAHGLVVLLPIQDSGLTAWLMP